MQRYFIQLSYVGTAYHGWQIQPNAMSVQEVLQNALRIILGNNTAVTGAGRTDTGVHARMMYAHFDGEVQLLASPLEKIAYQLNSILPKDISVQTIFPVPPDAHARFSAISRTYCYYFTTQKDVFHGATSYYFPFPLDFPKMENAVLKLLSHKDFSCFSKSKTQTKTNFCDIMEAGWKQDGTHYFFQIKADRFLRNMVRAIVGTLLDVGQGKMSVEEFQAVLESKNRCRAGYSVPAEGLFLEHIAYPPEICSEIRQI